MRASIIIVTMALIATMALAAPSSSSFHLGMHTVSIPAHNGYASAGGGFWAGQANAPSGFCDNPGTPCDDGNDCTVSDICTCFGNCTGVCPFLDLQVNLIRLTAFDETDEPFHENNNNNNNDDHHRHGIASTGDKNNNENDNSNNNNNLSPNVESCDVGSSGVFFVQCSVSGLPSNCTTQTPQVLIIATVSSFVNANRNQNRRQNNNNNDENNDHHHGIESTTSATASRSSTSRGVSTTGRRDNHNNDHNDNDKNKNEGDQCILTDLQIVVACNSMVRISLRETCSSQSSKDTSKIVVTSDAAWNPKDFSPYDSPKIQQALALPPSTSSMSSSRATRTTGRSSGSSGGRPPRTTSGSSGSTSSSRFGNGLGSNEDFPHITADQVVLAASLFDTCREEIVRSPILDPTVNTDCSRRRKTGPNSFVCCPMLDTPTASTAPNTVASASSSTKSTTSSRLARPTSSSPSATPASRTTRTRPSSSSSTAAKKTTASAPSAGGKSDGKRGQRTVGLGDGKRGGDGKRR